MQNNQNRVRLLLAIAWFAFAGMSFGWTPVANNDSYSTTINTTLTIAAPGVLANDTDRDQGTVLRSVLVSTTTKGALTLSTNGSFTYQPNTNSYGSDSFTYKASDGGSTSAVATVTIAVNPIAVTITKAPTNTTVCAGSTATFSVTANGTGLRYQWRFGTNNLAAQTNSSLSIANVSTASAGTYSVVVSGVSGGPLTNSATLSLYTPVSTTPLVNAARMVGGVVIFSTTASGSSPITFQWKKDGTNLVGKTNSSLLLTNLTITNAGTYSVVASGPCNSVTQSAYLDVDYCFPAVDVALVIDRSGSMQGQPFIDAKTASSNFVKNLKFGVTNDRAALISYATTSTLDRVLTNNATALYQAISNTPAANGYTCISCGIQTAQNELASVRHNSNALPVLVLMSDGMPTAGDTGSNAIYQATIAKNAGTRVFSVGLGDVDHALMGAIASSTNDYFYTTNSAQLTALFNKISEIICRPPTNIFLSGLTNQTVCSGSTATLSISASNCASFTYQWRRGSTNLVGQTNKTFVIANPTVADAGTYAVVVSSMCQTLTNSMTLTVNQSLTVNTPPANQTSFVGSNATFSINAIGTGIAYQWFFKGALVGTGSTLTLNNLTTNQAGTYCVVISGTCGASITNCAVLTIPNRPPVALPDSYTIAEDSTLSVPAPGVLGNDSDLDGDTLTSLLVTPPSRGSITLNANGSFTYVPTSNFNGTDTFTYKASDGITNSGVATVTISVTPQNDAPVAKDDAYSVNADSTLNIVAPGVLGNDTDVENNPLTAALINNPSHGSVTLNANGSFTYIPVTDFSGSDSFTYRANDGQTNSNPATVTIRVIPNNIVVTNPPTDHTNCPGDTVSFDVTATGTSLTYQWYFGTNTLFNQTNHSLVLTNVTSTNSGEYCVVIEGAAGGSITNCASLIVNSNTIVTVPPTNQVVCPGQTVPFTVTATGTELTYEWYHGNTLISSVHGNTLVITNVTANDAGTYTVITRGVCGEFVTNATTLVVNDVVTIVTPPMTQTNYVGSNVTFGVVATGTALTYQWFFNGVLVSTNSTLDLNNLTTNRAGIYCVVVSGACGTPVTNCVPLIIQNRPPVANNDNYTLDEDTTLTIAAPGVLANDSDIDGDTLSVFVVSAPMNGTVTLNANGSFTYTPNRNFNGLDSFAYRASDTKLLSDNAMVRITVNPVNDEPTAIADDKYTVAEDTLLVVPASSGVLTNDIDIDDDLTALSALLVDTTTNGVLQLSANGSFTYLPKTNFFGVDHFKYRASDGKSTSSVAVATITVTAVNDPPTVSITSPTNGTFFVALANIRVSALAADLDGVVTNVTLFSGPTAVRSFATNAPTMVLSNLLPGVYSLRAIATDNGGLRGTSAIVSVTVTSPPLSLICANTKTIELGNSWSFDPPTPVGGCGTNFVAIINTVTNPLCGKTYNATRTWRVTDQCGTTAECSQLVLIVDTTPPVITAAPDKVVELGTVWAFDQPTATDLSGVTVTVFNTTTNAGACGNGYIARQTWLATDGCGNTNTATQTVTVLDRIAPTINCSANKTVELGTQWSFDPPAASDLSAFTIAVVNTSTNKNGSCGNGFIATRVWRATDACGNSNECSQVVTVVDRTAPTIACSTNKTVELGTAWNFDPPTASDLSSYTISIVSTVTNAGSCGNGYVAIRTWRATDACNNSNQCSQVVTVVDRTAPTITCSQNKTVEAGVAWDFDAPTASDRSSFTIAVVSTTTNYLCGGSYVATRVWSATDACNNSNTCSQVVTVNDTTTPVVSIVSPTNGAMFIFPTTISLVATAYDAGGIESVAFYANSNLIATVSNAPYFFMWTNAPLGSNSLQAVATDFCGHGATSAVVTILVTTNTFFAAGPITLNRQNGLFEQHLIVSNLTSETWLNGVRVFVDIDKTNRVFNATGTNAFGVAYVDVATPVGPGNVLEVLVQYYVPNTRMVPKPNIVAVPRPYEKPAPVPPRLIATAGNVCGVTFQSTSQGWYYVEWSDDLKKWTVDPTPIRGNGGACSWMSDKSAPHRFYRVLMVP